MEGTINKDLFILHEQLGKHEFDGSKTCSCGFNPHKVTEGEVRRIPYPTLAFHYLNSICDPKYDEVKWAIDILKKDRKLSIDLISNKNWNFLVGLAIEFKALPQLVKVINILFGILDPLIELQTIHEILDEHEFIDGKCICGEIKGRVQFPYEINFEQVGFPITFIMTESKYKKIKEYSTYCKSYWTKIIKEVGYGERIKGT